uniref:Uncharacterized protein n=1 Tax=viral metagenome TaxID=1070528 RepID=A0A6M3JLP0_9ZZZZ
MKIIDIASKLTNRSNKDMERLEATFKQLRETKNPDDIIALIVSLVVVECKAGLGLADHDGSELIFFETIHEVYQWAAGDCYFCQDLDPNEIKVDKKTHLCTTCKQKMANFLRAIGVDPGKILAGMK